MKMTMLHQEVADMSPPLAFNLWHWIKQYRQTFELPVGIKVVREYSQFTAIIIH
jgi:hypothetical protein